MSFFSKLFKKTSNEDDFDSIMSKSARNKPRSKAELQKLIKETIEKNGPNCDLNFIDVSCITDMSELFYKSQFNGNISNWNVSNVTNMKWMFYDSKFNSDISSWDVSHVTNMSRMFKGSLFNGDISKWNVSNVTNMSFMFKDSQFNGDISKWDVSNVTDMSYMFYKSQFNGDISNWNVSNVTNMENMYMSSKFNGDLSKWNVSNVTDMNGLFANTSFNRDISNWNVSKVTNMKNMFGCESYAKGDYCKFNGDISKWNVSNVTNMEEMFDRSDFNGDISNWNVSNVTNMRRMFRFSEFHGDLKKWNIAEKWKLGTDITNMFWGTKFSSAEINALFIDKPTEGNEAKTNKIDKTQPQNKKELQKLIKRTIEKNGPNCDLNFIDVSCITDMSELFGISLFNDIDISNFNGNISQWNVSNVKNMNSMFSGDFFNSSKFNGDLSKWNVSNVTDMGEMFKYSIFNGDISNWDVSNVTDMHEMFNYSQFHGDIINWNLAKKWKSGTDITDMFVNSKFSSAEISTLLPTEGITVSLKSKETENKSDRAPTAADLEAIFNAHKPEHDIVKETFEKNGCDLNFASNVKDISETKNIGEMVNANFRRMWPQKDGDTQSHSSHCRFGSQRSEGPN